MIKQCVYPISIVSLYMIMGNQQSDIYDSRVGFEDVQRCIYESAHYCKSYGLTPYHTWSINHFQHSPHPPKWILVNTMKNTPEYQQCILPYTIPPSLEEPIMNWFLQKKYLSNIKIIVYGLNTCDALPEKKYNQLRNLGFTTYIYQGGMFEWLLLQDIYGDCREDDEDDRTCFDVSLFSNFDEIEFPTTQKHIDILRYRPKTRFPYLLTN